MTISGLTFVGGRNQLYLGNPNLNSAQILIEQCRFYAASGSAITFPRRTYSTQAIIKDCVFRECEQALITYCDLTVMRDCWIQSSPDMKDKAVIENWGSRLLLEHICGVPKVNGTDQRWIDNYSYGRLTCRDVRFGGEGGGFTPVVNFAKYFPTRLTCGTGPYIVLENCDISAGGNRKRQSAVYCEEIPNGITIRNSRLILVPALKFSKRINLKTYFRGATPGLLGFALEDNLGEGVGKLPVLLRHPIIEGKRIIAEISPVQTTRALAAAGVKVKKLAESPSASGLSFGEHRQQNEQGKFVEIGYSPIKWRLDDMGGTSAKNSEYLAVTPIGNDVIIMRRTSRSIGEWSARKDFPHVLIKDVVIDLDKYPFLTWKLRDAGMPSKYAVKVLDKESDVTQTLVAGGEPWTEYRAYNLKELFKTTGVRKFDIKFYYSLTSHLRKDWENRLQYKGQPGDYILLDFIRFEQE